MNTNSRLIRSKRRNRHRVIHDLRRNIRSINDGPERLQKMQESTHNDGRITMRKFVAAALMVVAIACGATALTTSPSASATTPVACEDIHWSLFERRAICDGPLLADGSWMRHRIIYSPAYWVPATTTCNSGRYTGTVCNTFGGFQQQQTIRSDDVYPVTPSTVLPDEPGWLGGA